MGSVCGKEDKGDNFTSPGRPLGTAPPPQPKTAPIPARVGGPPRTLGGGSGGGDGASGQQSADAAEARRKAAEAAEARAKAASKSTGKLSSQLNAQKKQTQTGLLKDASAQQLRQRDADAAAEARTYN
ncbi:hypothetical protein LZ32DRAFT_5142 [Colletotrichum eremochloae]|uniref:Uncharacterized protein n=1 Tax=Colletotrichum sublineola TaxID=1173701 RepID=A0A066XC18_COLSU|nr:hypothetical protein LY78DRAFT_236267 [Colletotrichum sublineola]KAK2020009.1 hypothetical protein LZ32DRAFT_5142 [Colletotrichum eremochloae]KDN66693.1 hypothetical protein CSUB01_01778 [Colletotrichum sublineola]